MPQLPAPPKPETEPAPVYNLSRRDMLWIAQEANILKIMGERQVRKVTVDFVPARPAIVLPRYEDDAPITACAPHVEEVTFYLEDTMFGGETFASLTCRGMVVVLPFLWSSWKSLAESRITPVT